MLLCEGATARTAAPRPWVACPDGVEAELDRLVAAVDRSPAASVALAQLLRVGEPLSAADAVVAESWVYSLLQAGAHHRELARGREPTAPASPGPTGRSWSSSGAARVLALTLDRPEVRNAYGTRTRDELVAALQLAAVDESIEVVELRGNGPAFCSGGDLDEFGTAGDAAAAHVVRTTRNAGIQLARLADRAHAFVHGPCVGAGVELPAFARRVTARSDATFLLPEVAMGLVPGAGGTASIPRRIGRHRTAHLALSGRPIDAATALDWGLVDVVDDDAFPDPPPGSRAPTPTPIPDARRPPPIPPPAPATGRRGASGSTSASTTSGGRAWPPPARTPTARPTSSAATSRPRCSTPGAAPAGSPSSWPGAASRWRAPTSTPTCSSGPGPRRPSCAGTSPTSPPSTSAAPSTWWSWPATWSASSPPPTGPPRSPPLAAHVAPGGRLISGCQLRAGLADRSTSTTPGARPPGSSSRTASPRGPATRSVPGPDYSVAVHRRPV